MAGALLQDFRQAVRSAARAPAFTVFAALTLGIGIGGTAIVLAVLFGVLARPLPFPESDRLVDLSERSVRRAAGGFGVSPAAITDWRAGAKSLEGVAAYLGKEGTLSIAGRAEKADYALASSEIFSTLRVSPVLGRPFTAAEDTPGRQDVVVLSDAFWRRAFGADPGAIGRTLAIDGKTCLVIGVLPAGVDFPGPDTALWRPIGFDARALADRRSRWVEAVGRLRGGVPLAAAERELQRMAARVAQAEPATNAGWDVLIRPLRERFVSGIRPALRVFSLAVALLFLVACANVAALLLTRASARRKEFAIRSALGAGSGRIARQILVETAVLAGSGGVLGFGLAVWGLALLHPFLSRRVPSADDLGADAILPVGTFALAALAAALSSLLPALRVSRAAPADALRGARTDSGASGATLSQRSLVVAEIALALVLLAGSAALGASFRNLLRVNPGFVPGGLAVVRLAPAWKFDPQQGQVLARYAEDRDAIARTYADLLRDWQTLPGFVAAGAINRPPLGGNWWSTELRVEGRPADPPGTAPFAQARVVAGDYFRAIQVPLSGRGFSDSDVSGSTPVAIVSRALARRLWPGGDAIGRRVAVPDLPPPYNGWRTVVGVAGDVRYQSLATEPKPVFYIPLSQTIQGFFGDWGMSFFVRTSGDPRGLLAPLRTRIARMAPETPVREASIVDDQFRRALETPRFSMSAFGFFAGLSLLLCAIGIYGVVTQSTLRRTSEIGIRVALGATPGDVVKLVLREGAALAALGTGIGLLSSIVLLPLLRGMLFEVSPAPVSSLAATVGVVGAVALLATWLPARRAARLDAIASIRQP